VKAILVERHIIKYNNDYYKMLDKFCYNSKNLYNHANYNVRKRFVEEKLWLKYNEMDKLFKQEGRDFDYRNMPSAQSAQQNLRLLEKNWKSFFKAIKDWKINSSKYTGMPKLPNYLPKDGRNIITLTTYDCKLKENIIKFPKTFNGFYIKTKISNLQQVRILPRNKHFIIEIVYRKEIIDLKEDSGRYLGIDIGLDNLATIANNVGALPMIINGKGLKSINKFYNKKISHYQGIAKRMNNMYYTNRMNNITLKRNNLINNIIHKASKIVVDYALCLDINTIIIGNNKDWKRNSPMSKRVNQSFVGIPHQDFIRKIIYKANNVGIKVILTEESYTSGTSFLDNELPTKEFYNKSRRVFRGLFKSNIGKLINADLNGAFQIIRKVFPNVKADGIEGIGLCPIRVNVK